MASRFALEVEVCVYIMLCCVVLCCVPFGFSGFNCKQRHTRSGTNNWATPQRGRRPLEICIGNLNVLNKRIHWHYQCSQLNSTQLNLNPHSKRLTFARCHLLRVVVFLALGCQIESESAIVAEPLEKTRPISRERRWLRWQRQRQREAGWLDQIHWSQVNLR